jgi:hypothetical protein
LKEAGEVFCSVFLGKVSAIWLLATMDALPQLEGLKEFVKSSTVGKEAFISQNCQTNMVVSWRLQSMEVDDLSKKKAWMVHMPHHYHLGLLP